MDAAEWLEAFAREVGAEPLPAELVDQLLELAAEAAHSSERKAAPIACYIAGMAGLDAAVAIEAARSIGGPAT